MGKKKKKQLCYRCHTVEVYAAEETNEVLCGECLEAIKLKKKMHKVGSSTAHMLGATLGNTKSIKERGLGLGKTFPISKDGQGSVW